MNIKFILNFILYIILILCLFFIRMKLRKHKITKNTRLKVAIIIFCIFVFIFSIYVTKLLYEINI